MTLNEEQRKERLKALREAMSRSVTSVENKTEKDSKDLQEESAASRRHKAETQTIIESNLDLKINRKLRWKYASWVFCYLVCYSAFVAILLILSGFKICGFTLQDSVLEFLVGSTALSAIGLVAAVVHGLFGKKS